MDRMQASQNYLNNDSVQLHGTNSKSSNKTNLFESIAEIFSPQDSTKQQQNTSVIDSSIGIGIRSK